MIESFDYILAFCLIAFAGFVDSIAGGGGLITVPTYLFLGLPPQVLLGTNKLVSSVGASLTIFRYTRAKAINWSQFKFPILVSFLAAVLGAYLLAIQSRELMLGILIVISPLVFLISLKKPKHQKFSWMTKKLSTIFLILMSALLGCYDGFFGPGTGSFFLFGLMYLLAFPAKEASANARILNYASNLGALIFFFSQLKFSLGISVLGIVASLIGNYFGSHLVINHANRVVRPLYLIVLTLLIFKLVWEFYF